MLTSCPLTLCHTNKECSKKTKLKIPNNAETGEAGPKAHMQNRKDSLLLSTCGPSLVTLVSIELMIEEEGQQWQA